MQRSVNSLIGYTISAKDGELGKVNEFYFDDLTWSIRYLVVETGSWLSERKVLIPHAALGITDWKSQTFQVNLTMEQVRNSPDFESEKTVSRQHEIKLFTHYGLPVYWDYVFYDGSIGMGAYTPIIDMKTVKEENDSVPQPPDDPHLRSTKHVEGYYIHANDGEIGHVEDYIVDDEKWNICFIIVDTTNWLPGRKVLILPRWIKRIDWGESKVYVNLMQESIKNSPEFDSSQPIGDEYARELFKHYGEDSKPC
ncbi:MAG: PRC-barrel domain-containing protein [Ignavibacteriaceae bacterium]|jgi:sporulation protein YlmC with PRC-barrel domain|nr:PRC-barrel domain-containing protein [Ignavibacteriaceae bacterium]